MEITALPVYDVRLIRDKLTNTSRGFCFVELGSVEVNIKLFLLHKIFPKIIKINFC